MGDDTQSPMAPGSPVLPETRVQAVVRHLRNWAEIYLWIPIALLSILAASEFAYFLTGRRPTENADWIPEFSFRLVACVLVIALVSISRQQTGFWLTKTEAMAYPKLAFQQALTKCFFAALFAYILLH